MRVKEVMTRGVKTCYAEDTLYRAAQTMWENECGCVPVVDEAEKLVGMLTDRDICLSSLVRGKSLREITVADEMREDPVSWMVWSCGPGDHLAVALAAMAEHKVHRLPVLDGGKLVGILSLDDIALEVTLHQKGRAGVTGNDVCEALAAISKPE